MNFSWLNKLIKQTELKGQHSFILFLLCLYVADHATGLASNILFSSENCLFIQLWREKNSKKKKKRKKNECND